MKLGLDEIYVYPIDVDFGDREQDIYHLIHASRSPRARLAMEEAVSGANSLLKQDALSLYDASVQDRILEELGAAGTATEASRLAGRVWLRTWEATWHTDIRQAVKALEAEGQVEVLPQPGKTHKPGKPGEVEGAGGPKRQPAAASVVSADGPPRRPASRHERGRQAPGRRPSA